MDTDPAGYQSNSPSSDSRFDQIQLWLAEDLKIQYSEIKPASSDASFRRYFRVINPEHTFIVMDAPPEKEDCRDFMAIAWVLRDLGVHAPEILEIDQERGFLLLDDFGATSYLDVLKAENADALYADALDSLARMQLRGPREGSSLPLYDVQLLRREMELFREWLLQRHWQISLNDQDNQLLDNVFDVLVKNALEQPQVFVHRDYHSRNLMVMDENNPGVLDFQDAVVGPITYDLVSLLRDCYIAWPKEKVLAWMQAYFQRDDVKTLVADKDEQTLKRWFDLMGVQRHLKASGIFARLNYRDGKTSYLADVPRTVNYIIDVVAEYPELSTFSDWLRQRVLPLVQ